ncbi:hypothetical protein B488_04840 [Liberibacter crescens BT-1]|uniref:Uncharacterized protein n=1 Tax=Liberibacter crescens (strain BT-1) TaxID=1215343 RepID=L0EVQ9_LIBCB|nr:hypothetical protein B488_04840 [Liberibacter crescens BT-1]
MDWLFTGKESNYKAFEIEDSTGVEKLLDIYVGVDKVTKEKLLKIAEILALESVNEASQTLSYVSNTPDNLCTMEEKRKKKRMR